MFLFLGVENKAGVTRDSAILEVERRERPEIEIYPSPSQSVIQGGSVLFQCRVLKGIPNPTINWRNMDGSAFGRNVEILANGGVIRITDIQKANEGRFECNATNIAGYMTAVASLKVRLIKSNVSFEKENHLLQNFAFFRLIFLQA